MRRYIPALFAFAAPLVAHARGEHGGGRGGDSSFLIGGAVVAGAVVLAVFVGSRGKTKRRDSSGRFVSQKPAPAKADSEVDVVVKVRGSKAKK